MRFLGLTAAAVAVVLAIASPAAARDLRCDGVFKGKTFDDVTVPRGAACTLINSKVRGDVKARANAYFQATRTVVRGDVEGNGAQTIFVDTGTKVTGSVESKDSAQFFVFNSTVGEDIEPEGTAQAVQICGNSVRKGNIEVRRSGTDILIGDPLAVGCRGNVVRRGDIKIVGNVSLIEFVIRGNVARRGDLIVTRNSGPTPKFVDRNVGGGRLVCRDNSLMSAGANVGWDRKVGQCA